MTLIKNIWEHKIERIKRLISILLQHEPTDFELEHRHIVLLETHILRERGGGGRKRVTKRTFKSRKNKMPAFMY